MSDNVFKLESKFSPAGDQPRAIKELYNGLKGGLSHQTLLGVTGSGKTFTVANIIEKMQMPTLVIAHNKTLAAQLAQEFRDFFPHNAVHYFVSYYDYYQPEAYVASSDTYIEKEAQINEEIDRLRHASTQSLMSRRDVIVVASVSCIYGLGSPAEYIEQNLVIKKDDSINRLDLIKKLIEIRFERTNTDLLPGFFRVIGNILEIMPTSEKLVYRLNITLGKIDNIQEINYISRAIEAEKESIIIFPAKHFITDKERLNQAIKNIKTELRERLKYFSKHNKLLEADRLKRRTNYDLALLKEVGYCNGIENYSRHLSGRNEGEAPDTLLSYFPKKHRQKQTSNGQIQTIEEVDFLTIIDESHVTVPQIGGMYAGDASRKQNLIEHGFRLPSAKDNRPLTFKEFEGKVGQVIFTSATPSKYESQTSQKVVEQIIRPTGLVDPLLEVRPVSASQQKESKIELTRLDEVQGAKKRKHEAYDLYGEGLSDAGNEEIRKTPKFYKSQVFDFIDEAELAIKKGGRVLATTLTKKMAEELSEFLKVKGINSTYLHSDIQTLERIEILGDLRAGKFDCLVGVNLLREGLDLPEVTLIGILDADKEGFLRSETSLIQIIGRAARNVDGKVILYADRITQSLKNTIKETDRRRNLQTSYNKKHNITPKTIVKNIKNIIGQIENDRRKTIESLIIEDKKIYGANLKKLIKEKERQMNEAVKILDFESAAIIRDEIKMLSQHTNKHR